MRIAVICFTEAGASTAITLMEGLLKEGELCEGFGKGPGLKPLTLSLGEWTKEQFIDKDGIVFIGAMGIAVRSIAPYIKGKAVDPAVVVLDDQGRFSISVLSGHLGGANELAERSAEITGGQAVITTATDIHGKFAADLFAKRLGLAITELNLVKKVSAAVLRGETVGFHSDFPIDGRLPEELCLDAKNRHRPVYHNCRFRGEGKNGSFPQAYSKDSDTGNRVQEKHLCYCHKRRGNPCIKGT
ncbi:cobalamin biosynthesis central domain-containing protein [Lacrimispora xylanisolvens]|uniref:cobalamin biosynthesis central domain-containing protein n=1 Tax=Lacrimispora xylanisolvens TaxID=384636 RepID=UPI002402CBE0